ncbi:helix-turn-helix domain-containing protein [Sphingomonas sp. MA1305]|uniref:helix-turn-helix domain-containing protein n=1 Tax=Sphingomonas sp. MA1305 TaxID=2479204 RepID=UPI001E62BC63|nr:helix-turn-helix transcriptional regulator [Sphingomonas sp. MA1305]
MRDQELIGAEAAEVGRRVREELARRRISRQALADMARVSLSTLEKALAGTRPFTLATTIRLEEALGLPLRPAASPASTRQTAPEHLGSYARAAVGWLEGRYLTLRPSFNTPDGIFAYLTTIRWSDELGHLGFVESERADARFEQAGHVSLPNLSGHIYLVTNEQGQHRLQTLSRPAMDGTLYGVLATLQAGRGSQLMPVAAPVAMAKVQDTSACAFGLIVPGADGYDRYCRMLAAAISDNYVHLYQAPGTAEPH